MGTAGRAHLDGVHNRGVLLVPPLAALGRHILEEPGGKELLGALDAKAVLSVAGPPLRVELQRAAGEGGEGPLLVRRSLDVHRHVPGPSAVHNVNNLGPAIRGRLQPRGAGI